MRELYVEVFSDVDVDGKCEAPLESLVVLFNYAFCDLPPVLLTLVIVDSRGRCSYDLCLNYLMYNAITVQQLTSPADLCKLPIIVMHEGTTVVAGVCAVSRQLFKSVDPIHPYLGFKQSCLYACAETSIWTKFCEIDALRMVEETIGPDDKNVCLSQQAARFETHMAQPVRVHNIQKVKQDMARAKGNGRASIPDSRLQIAPDLEHFFAEGTTPTLADIILFPCFHLYLQTYGIDILKWFIPLTCQWYTRMQTIENIPMAMKIIGKVKEKYCSSNYLNCVLPSVPVESLYRSDPRRSKEKAVYTRQDEIEASLQIMETLSLDMLQTMPFGADVAFEWSSVPYHARPEGGDLPAKRSERKCEQLENLARAVLKVAQNSDCIADFCTGSGHLGLIIAHFLPRCTIILLDNKEESLNRARTRAKKLQLGNIFFCQSNIDYFQGRLNVGVSLHACGVATDLVLSYCIKQNAAFVCCPCCYGSVQANHMLTYPRSALLRDLPLSQREYFVLGHAADQTHEDTNSKTAQGIKCMNFIDADRCFNAREAGYWVSLSKLLPVTCTPKNNLLIGIPGHRVNCVLDGINNSTQ